MNQRNRARVITRSWIGAVFLCAMLSGFSAPPVSAGGGEPRAEAPPVAPTPPAAPAPDAVAVPRVPGHAPHAPRAMRIFRRSRDDDDGPRVRIDTLLVVQPGSKLVVYNFGGNVALRAWPRNAVQLMVERAAEDRVAIVRAGKELKLESVSADGVPRDMTFDLTVPAWLPVSLTGVNNDVHAEGLAGGLDVETVHGDIVARRVTGPVALHSVEGVVDLANARGKIDVSSVNDAVRVSDAAGDIAAEAVNGDVHLVSVDSRKVEATTVSGDVVYDSPLHDGGQYSFSTHDGDIAVGLPEAPNAVVNVSTFGGDFASAFAIRPERSARGKRLHFTLGNGGAQMNLESFQGSIELLRSGQGELRRKIDEAQRARAEALKQWGEWNPMRRMEWKTKMEQMSKKMEKLEKMRIDAPPAPRPPDDDDKGDDKP